MKLSLLIVANLVACLVNARRIEAQRSAPLPVEAALNTLSFAQLSPVSMSRDGKWLAYSIKDNRRRPSQSKNENERQHQLRTGVAIENEATDVWTANTETGETKNLTGGQNSNWDPVWSPDGHNLAFLSDRDGSSQARVWVWNVQHATLRMVSTANVRTNTFSPEIEWTPDSRAVVVTLLPENLTAEAYVQKIMMFARSPTKALASGPQPTVAVLKAAPASEKDVGTARATRLSLDGLYLHDVALMEIATGKTIRLTHDERVGWYSISPDGSRLGYLRVKSLSPFGSFRRVFELMYINLKTREIYRLSEDSVIADTFSWSPDSTQIAFLQVDVQRDQASLAVGNAITNTARTAATIKHSVGSYVTPFWDSTGKHVYILVDGTLWRVALEGGEAAEFASIPARKILRRAGIAGDVMWIPDASNSTVVLTLDPESKQSGFFSVNLTTGETSKLLESGQCFDCNSRGASGGFGLVAASRSQLAYIAQDAQHSPDLWVSDPGFMRPHRMTHLNPQFEDYAVGSPRLIRWLSLDGKPLKGALLLPPDYEPTKRYPLIVYVYPTTLSDDYDRFGFGVYPGPLNLHLFATRGYVVLLPDVQGENGANVAAIEGSVLPAINETIRLGMADPERIGVIGHSAGGYSTLALITRTGRFRAAMEISGYGDLFGLYGQLAHDGSAYGSDEVGRSLGANPWQDPFRYILNSPIFYLDRVRAPLLIVQGDEDDAVSSTLADEVFVTLRRLGKEAEYAKYQGESHVPRDWSYANQLDLCRRQLDWFETRLKGELGTDPLHR